MSTLLVYASAIEVAGLTAQQRARCATLEIGVGKVCAAMNLSAALASERPEAVLLVGVCGAYPPRHLPPGQAALAVGELVIVASERAGDEGVLTPGGFLELSDLGLADAGPLECDCALSGALATLLGCPIVAGATVSTGAGTEALSRAHLQRTHARIETMEGAAVAAVCRHHGVRLVQLRAVSNMTGDRDRGQWNLDRAVNSLCAGLSRVLESELLP